MGTEVITASGAKPGNLPAVAAAAAAGVQVGCAIVATRFVIDQTDPVTLGFLRYLIGFCLLLFPAWRSARRCARGWFKRRNLKIMESSFP